MTPSYPSITCYYKFFPPVSLAKDNGVSIDVLAELHHTKMLPTLRQSHRNVKSPCANLFGSFKNPPNSSCCYSLFRPLVTKLDVSPSLGALDKLNHSHLPSPLSQSSFLLRFVLPLRKLSLVQQDRLLFKGQRMRKGSSHRYSLGECPVIFCQHSPFHDL